MHAGWSSIKPVWLCGRLFVNVRLCAVWWLGMRLVVGCEDSVETIRPLLLSSGQWRCSCHKTGRSLLSKRFLDPPFCGFVYVAYWLRKHSEVIDLRRFYSGSSSALKTHTHIHTHTHSHKKSLTDNELVLKAFKWIIQRSPETAFHPVSLWQ